MKITIIHTKPLFESKLLIHIIKSNLKKKTTEVDNHPFHNCKLFIKSFSKIILKEWV